MPNGLPVASVHFTTSFSATNDAPEPCSRKSHSANAVFNASAPCAILSLGKLCLSNSSTPLSSLLGHRYTSVFGRYVSSNFSTPGVCAISPIFTVCHDERSKMRFGLDPSAAIKLAIVAPSDAKAD